MYAASRLSILQQRLIKLQYDQAIDDDKNSLSISHRKYLQQQQQHHRRRRNGDRRLSTNSNNAIAERLKRLWQRNTYMATYSSDEVDFVFGRTPEPPPGYTETDEFAVQPKTAPKVINALFSAAKTGDIGMLRSFITKVGVKAKEFIEEVDETSTTGERPLHVAARVGHVTIIQDLITFGATVDVFNNAGNTPLILGTIENQLLAVKCLLTNGADFSIKGSHERTALHFACEKKTAHLAEELLKYNGSQYLIDAFDDEKNTCLHIAAASGNFDLVDLLLKSGSNALDWKNASGYTPLSLACYGGHYLIVKYLLEHDADWQITGHLGRTAFHRAIEPDHVGIVELMLDGGKADPVQREAEIGGNALHVAAMFGAVKCIALLLDRDANLESKTEQYGYSSLQVAAVYGRAAAIELLIDRGADKEYRGLTGRTPLHLASHYGHLSAVVSLVKSGVWMENKDDLVGATAMHFACYFGRLDVVKFLTNAGADKSSRDVHGDTPLHWATLGDQPTVISFLLSRGTETSIKDSRIGRTALHDAVTKDFPQCATVLLGRANIEAADDENAATPLHLACWFGRATMAKLLLSRRVNIAVRDRNNYCPIHWAAMRGCREVIEVLAQHNVNVNVKGGQYGRTALHMTAQWGHLDCAQMLIENGANLEAVDERRGATALHLAAQFTQQNMVQLLIAFGSRCDAVDDHGQTPLHVAASYNCVGGEHYTNDSIRAKTGMDFISVNDSDHQFSGMNAVDQESLCSSSLNIVRSNDKALSALMAMSSLSDSSSNLSKRSSQQAMKLSAQLAIIGALLDRKPQLIDMPTSSTNRTPLMCAAMKGQLHATEFLMQHGANGSLKDKSGKTALRLAFDNQHYNIVRMFVKLGVTN